MRAGRTAADNRSALPDVPASPVRLPPRYAHATRRRSWSPPPAQTALPVPAPAGSTAAGRAAGSSSRRRLPRGQGGAGRAGGASVDRGRPCTSTPFALVEPPSARKKTVALDGSARSTSDSTPAKKERRRVPCRAISVVGGGGGDWGWSAEAEGEEEAGSPAGAEQSTTPVAHRLAVSSSSNTRARTLQGRSR